MEIRNEHQKCYSHRVIIAKRASEKSQRPIPASRSFPSRVAGFLVCQLLRQQCQAQFQRALQGARSASRARSEVCKCIPARDRHSERSPARNGNMAAMRCVHADHTAATERLIFATFCTCAEKQPQHVEISHVQTMMLLNCTISIVFVSMFHVCLLHWRVQWLLCIPLGRSNRKMLSLSGNAQNCSSRLELPDRCCQQCVNECVTLLCEACPPPLQSSHCMAKPARRRPWSGSRPTFVPLARRHLRPPLLWYLQLPSLCLYLS